MKTIAKKRPLPKASKKPARSKFKKGSVDAWLYGFGEWAGDPEELVRLEKEVEKMREESIIDFSKFDDCLKPQTT